MATQRPHYHVCMQSDPTPLEGSLILKIEFTQRCKKLYYYQSTNTCFTVEDRLVGELYSTYISIFPNNKTSTPVRTRNFSETVRRELGTDAIEQLCVSRVRKLNERKLSGGMRYIVKVEFQIRNIVRVEEPEKEPRGATKLELMKVEKVELDSTVGECCCVVCFDELDAQSEVIRMPNCGHVFHESCILCWLKEQKTCPSCRSKLGD